MEYIIPQNLYGLAIAEPLQLDKHADGLFIYVLEHIKVFLLLTLNYMVQFGFLNRVDDFYERNWADHYHLTCSDRLEVLQIVCVFVFSVAVFGEIRESLDMWAGLWFCPVTDYKLLEERHSHHGAVLEKDDAADASNEVDRLRRETGHLLRKGIKGEHRWNMHRMTNVHKFLALVFVASPKLLIGVLTLVYGSKYIMLSPDAEDLILNTLAVLFVVDVDEYFYATFTTAAMKARLASMTPIQLDENQVDRVVGYLWGTVGIPLVVGGTTHYIVYSHRRRC